MLFAGSATGGAGVVAVGRLNVRTPPGNVSLAVLICVTNSHIEKRMHNADVRLKTHMVENRLSERVSCENAL